MASVRAGALTPEEILQDWQRVLTPRPEKAFHPLSVREQPVPWLRGLLVTNVLLAVLAVEILYVLTHPA